MTTFAASKHGYHEENISAIEQEKKEQARVQGADVNGQRQRHHYRQEKKRTQEIVSLRRTTT